MNEDIYAPGYGEGYNSPFFGRKYDSPFGSSSLQSSVTFPNDIPKNDLLNNNVSQDPSSGWLHKFLDGLKKNRGQQQQGGAQIRGPVNVPQSAQFGGVQQPTSLQSNQPMFFSGNQPLTTTPPNVNDIAQLLQGRTYG